MILNKHRTSLFILSVVFAVFGALFVGKSVQAAPVVNKILPGIMPAYIENYLLSCGGTNNASAQIGWLSLQGQPTQTVIDVPNGTSNIQLQYNVVGIVCRASSMGGLVSTTNGIIASVPSSLGIAGLTATYNYGKTNGDYSLGTPIVFTYTPAAPFTTSTDVSIGMTEKRINSYSISTRYRCVTNPGDVNFRTPISNTDFGACRSTGAPVFTIRVNVPPGGNAPLGTIDVANCDTWSGWAFDQDSINTSIKVHVYTGASAGQPGSVFVGEFSADQLRGDVNTKLGIGGNHGFNISVPAPYHSVNTTIWVYAIGVDSSGNQDGINAFIGSRSYTGCKPPPVVACSIAPIAILAGSSASPSVTIKHNGPALAPAANVAGALTVQGQPSDSIGASLANGASVTKTGTSRTYVTAGTYTITGSFVATSSVSTTNFSCASTLTVTLPPPVISCVVGITSIEEGGSTAVPVTVRHDGPAYAPGVNYAAKIAIVSQPIQNLSGSLANGSSVTLATATNTYPLQGVYAVTVRVTGTGGGFVTSAACNGTVTVLRRPYIRAYGNDIQAGLGFYNSAGTCNTGVGNIRAYTRDGAGSYAGSGSQLGIFARGQITGFRSASMRADALLLPEILSLANTTAVNRSIGQFGGSFGSGSCINDYWSKSINATVLSSQNIDLAALPNGRYYVKQSTPGTPVSVTGLIPNGRRIALYVEGNAFIRGGASVGYASSSWANRAEIPSLYIITKGNIMIGSDVKNLDGNYIAQNSNVIDGRITTCADPNTLQTYATNATFLINCTNKLTINGSFSAQHVNFLRVAGTTRLAVPSESSTSSNATEVFVYSLDTFLGDQAIEGHHQQTYDSITALPPSL